MHSRPVSVDTQERDTAPRAVEGVPGHLHSGWAEAALENVCSPSEPRPTDPFSSEKFSSLAL